MPSVAMIGVVLVFNIGISLATSIENYVYANFTINALLLLMIIYLSAAGQIMVTKFQSSQ